MLTNELELLYFLFGRAMMLVNIAALINLIDYYNIEDIPGTDAQKKSLSQEAYKKSLQTKNVKPYKKVHDVALQRLKNELKTISLDPLTNISARLKNDNLFEWEAVIQGPPDTPYEGGKFLLDLEFSDSYPLMPPKVTFKTKIYHCNINSEGYISLDRLGKNWTTILWIKTILLSIQSLFTDCNPDDCLVPEIAAQYVNNREEHDRICREWTKKYATEEADF